MGVLGGLGGASMIFNLPGPDLLSVATAHFTDVEVEEGLKLAGASEGSPSGEETPLWDKLKKTAVFGLPGLMGVDASDFIGVGSLRDVARGLFGPGVKDTRALTEFAYRATADLAAFGFVDQETMSRFVNASYPSWVRRIANGRRVLETGEVRNPFTGKLLYQPEQRLATALRFSLGFPEIRFQQERIMDVIVNRKREKWQRGRTTLAKEAARARLDGREEDAAEAIRRARGLGMDIESRTVEYWMRELGKTGAQRRLRRTPADLRMDMLEYFKENGPVGEREFRMETEGAGVPDSLKGLIF
jgi:hypothetical protein